MNRWPNQIKAIEETTSALLAGAKRICVTSPTGTGKTTMMIDLIEWAVDQNLSVALYTNRQMLFDQTYNVLLSHGVRVGRRAAKHEPATLMPVQLCMTQTVASRSNIPDAKIVIVDELHNQCGDQVKAILQQHYDEGAAMVGYTATPLDIGEMVDELVVAGTVSGGRECGALVPAYTFGPDEPDLGAIKKYRVGDDLSERDNVKAMMRPGVFSRVYDNWARLNAEWKPTILFAPDVAGSIFFAEEFTRRGVRAAHIDGNKIWLDGELHESDKTMRDELARLHKCRELPVVCNRFVLREGIDWPWVEYLVLATVFGSLTAYLQSCGRGLRAYPGKHDVMVQDHGGCLDEETEILTRRGWVGIDDMKDGDSIGTMDMSSGSFEWCPNLGTLRKPCDGEMLYLQSNYLNLRVTDYHNMVMRADTRGGDWKLASAKSVSLRNSNWIIPTSADEQVSPCALTDHEIRFIGWFLTDGNIEPGVPHPQRGYRNRVRIYQSANAPRAHHVAIQECLHGCGFRFSIRNRKRKSPFDGSPYEEVCYGISSGRKSTGGWKRLDEWLDKSIPVEIFERLDSRQFGVLLEAMNLGDGLKCAGRINAIALAIASESASSNLQSIAVRRGFRCNRRFQLPGKINEAGIFILNLKRSCTSTVAKEQFGFDSIGGERVWCVQTKNKTILIRRSGCVAIVGNSWWRHGSVNADREWSLGMTNNEIVTGRLERMRSKQEQEPIHCPKCSQIRLSGAVCKACGYSVKAKSRVVVQVDGTLRTYRGDICKPRKVAMQTDTEKLWSQIYWRCRKSKTPKTMGQARGLFYHQYKYYPPENLPLMPRNASDWSRRILDIPMSDLIQRQKTGAA